MEVLKERYSITELSELLNITDHALRFYEKEFGLSIPKDTRGRRFYTTELANLMYQIKNMRDEGLELKAIRKILQDENIIPAHQVVNMPEKQCSETLPAVINSPATNELARNELNEILDALAVIKDQLYSNVSTEFCATREHISKEIYKSKLELGACVENSSRKLEMKLDRHFQEVDKSITNWRDRKNTSFSSKLKRLVGR